MAKKLGIRLSAKASKKDSMFRYASEPRRQSYRPSGVHVDFQCLVNSPETAEAHKFLKAAAALEGVPMVRLHKLSASTKRRLKNVIGDGKELPVNECLYLMDNILNVLGG